ncbi:MULTISPECIES: helix-turn-helix domain-containing protein [unclassified Hwanghaeella]|jgi:transcriptional regulator with XRE-family HTH domain|uniref:helix-turn-helix domain-containing protein n=1 Tax=unclassified Hwanghaeella TaxID=2605944 RepID=UPI002696F410|tara:strand:- start:24421 stop:24993 length:573 start_codon:yes stop_codon:yes gene_type:complete
MSKDAKSTAQDSFARHVGQRIRYFRGLQDISLSELSRRSGIAKGTLSKLESGSGNPTIVTLGALAGILNITPGDFMEPRNGAPRDQSGWKKLAGPGITMLFLHKIVAAKSWDIYETNIPQTDAPIYSATHGGIEHLIMIEGVADVGPVDAPTRLNPGERVAFPGDKPHLYFAIGGPCTALLMMEHPAKRA